MISDPLIARYGLSRNGHAHFSPSGSAGWLNCDGYVLANADKPDNGGPDAAYGTVGHGIAATWLEAIRDQGKQIAEHVPRRFLNFKTVENGHEIICDAEMLSHIRRYTEFCAQVEHLGDVFIEQRLDYSSYMPIPKQGGTADHCVLVLPNREMRRRGRLIVTDLKLGIGIPVFAKGNTQCLCYALEVFLEWDWLYDFETIVIRICQPRRDYEGEWECTRQDLLDFGERVRAAALRGWKEGAKRTPGTKQCQWCADKLCGAKSALLGDIAASAFDGEVLTREGAREMRPASYSPKAIEEHVKLAPLFGKPHIIEPTAMSTSALAWRQQYRAMFEKMFEDGHEELLRRQAKGERLPGLKTVLGRQSFDWIDEDDALEMELLGLGLAPEETKVVTVKTISVKGARDLLRTKGLTNKKVDELFGLLIDKKTGKPLPGRKLVRVSRGKPTLAPATDERVDIIDEISEAFAGGDDL